MSLLQAKTGVNVRLLRIDGDALGFVVLNRDQEGRYTIGKRVITAPHAACLLVETKFTVAPQWRGRLKLFALLAPHLNVCGRGNHGLVEDVGERLLLTAHRGDNHPAMDCSSGFVRGSCGYVGTSDGWTDLADNRAMDWEFNSAPDGNIALIGEVEVSDLTEFVLAVSFSENRHGAIATLAESLAIIAFNSASGLLGHLQQTGLNGKTTVIFLVAALIGLFVGSAFSSGIPDTDTEAAATARDDLVALQKSAELAKDRLDVALQARKTAQEQLLTVDAKIAQDQAALDKLLGSPTPAGGETPKTTEPAGAVTAAPDTAPATDATAPATDGGAPATEVLTKPISEKVAESQERTQEKQEAAEAAREDITELRQRKRTLEQDIELEQQALTAERERQDLLDATLAQQEADYNAKTTAGAAAPELQAIRQLVTETQQQLRETRVSVRKRTDQLQQLRTQLLALQAEEIHLAESAEQKLREAVAAKRSEWLVTLRENTIVRGPKILVAILVMVFLWWLAKALSRRLVRIFSKSGGGQTAERENRAQTLGNVFDNAARVAIVVGGALMVLDIVGIPIGPLLGGAAVMGLAIAFGAQSLIKDYFTGFIVLLENQYKLNDVVTIGGMTGTVERITLRITVLRDFEGRVYFIPNGQVTSVTNHTHEWARAAVDVEIAYQENVDEVIDVLKSLTAELREDEQWKEIILADAEILGVDALRESAVAIRMGIKVLPAKQWALKRELLRRIKNRFDELGIEIPFPQQTVYHRYENEHPAEPFVRPPVQHASE